MSKVLADDIIPALKSELYGIGQFCVPKGSTDLNNYSPKTGFFSGQNGTNIPSTLVKNTLYVVLQIVVGEQNMIQILIPTFGPNTIHWRVKRLNQWTTWFALTGEEES